MLGALVVAFHLPCSGWGYVLYTIGSLAWIVAAIRIRERSILVQSVVYTVLNILGIYFWLIKGHL